MKKQANLIERKNNRFKADTSLNLGSKNFHNLYKKTKRLQCNSQMLKVEDSLQTQDSVFHQHSVLQIPDISRPWNSRLESSGYIDVSITQPDDFVHTDWFKILHQTKISHRVKAKDHISPQLKHLRDTLSSVKNFNRSQRKVPKLIDSSLLEESSPHLSESENQPNL